MEDMTMMPTVSVLDHGFVTLRNLAGQTRRCASRFDASDIDPAQAARMSFEQLDSERTYEEDMKLNHYLLSNGHTSPFEMISVWVEVKVPIFVDRQFVRHRTWRRNESSGRYIVLPGEYYIPQVVGKKPEKKKQGQDPNLPQVTQDWFRFVLRTQCENSYEHYLKAIDKDVAPEHARLLLHLNHYVHWLGNVDLGNLYKFLALRDHSHAQIEAQLYARAIIDLVRPELPGLMSLFDEVLRRD